MISKLPCDLTKSIRVEIKNDHESTFCVETLCNGQAQAGRSTRDNGDLVFESVHLNLVKSPAIEPARLRQHNLSSVSGNEQIGVELLQDCNVQNIRASFEYLASEPSVKSRRFHA